jgi:hypothetical protein
LDWPVYMGYLVRYNGHRGSAGGEAGSDRDK